MKKIPSSTGFIIRETIKGLPEATKTVGKYILRTPKRVIKKVISNFDEPLKLQEKRARKMRDEDRIKAIESSLKAGDYMYYKGDEELVPEVKKYK